MPRTRPGSWDSFLLVAIAAGGALGAPARYGLDRAIATPVHGFPWGTLAVNVSGCLLLGLLLTALLTHWPSAHYARTFATVGFLGSYTTFSAFALEADLLVKRGEVLSACLYVGASLLAGLVATALGLAVVRHSTEAFGLPRARNGAA